MKRDSPSLALRLVLAFSLFGAAAVAGIVYVTWRSFVDGNAGARIKRELAAAKAAGVPLEPQDLRRTPPIQDADNAAILYGAYFDALSKTPAKQRDERLAALGKVSGFKGTPQDLALSKRALEDWRGAIAILQQALAKPHCDYRHSYESGVMERFPESAVMRGAAKLLAGKAKLQADAGDPLGAIKTLRLATSLVRHAGEEPGALPMLARIATEAILLRALQTVAADHPSPSVLSEGRQVVASLGPEPSLVLAMRGEALLSWRTLEVLPAMPQNGRKPTEIKVRLTRSTRWYTGAQETCLRYYRRLLSVIDDRDGLASYRRVLDLNNEMGFIDGPHTYARSLLDMDHEGVAGARIACAARRLLALSYLDVLDAKLHSGQLPNQPPHEYTDPFDKKPLRYRRTADGFILYSVSIDFTDNEGKQRPPNTDSTIGWDLVAQYPAHEPSQGRPTSGKR